MIWTVQTYFQKFLLNIVSTERFAFLFGFTADLKHTPCYRIFYWQLHFLQVTSLHNGNDVESISIF